MLDERTERLISAVERLRLGEFVRFESDRKRRLADAFWQGVFRGLGIFVGFSILGALTIFILQAIARQNLPLIGDFVAKVILLVESRMR